MNKLYYPINWENYPSEATPINESNLNKIDSGLNNLDNRVIEQDAMKLSKTDASNDIVNWTMDEETGVITITRRSGEQILFDLNIEKIPVSFSLSDDGILTMVTDDGTTFTANIGAMIPILTFSDSDEIAVTATGTGINKTYSFSIKDNSITENKLQPNFLADIKVQSANASASASSAASSANDSSTYATQSKSYAVGGTGTRTGEDTDNAKYYNEQAQQALSEMQKSQVTGVKGDNETEFRTGEVNLTAENVGAVKTGGDVAENTVTYESNDVGPDGDPALWEIPKLTTGEKLSSIMQKVSRISNNFRYMIKLLGTTDISAIGDGTVTGGLTTLNDKLSHVGMIIHTTTLDTEDKVKAIYGGTSWSKIEGKFLLGQSSSYAINSTGGEATHKLTVNEMPSHNHAGKISSKGAYLAFYNDGTAGDRGTASYNSTGDTFSLTSNGGNKAHNNMPPYKTVYIWERTA